MLTLQLENITKTYGNLKAVDQVNVKLEEGVYGLLGHNGAGKTTIIKILATIIEANEGNLILDGDVVISGKDYRNLIGYMPQQQNLIPSMNVEAFLYYIASMKGLSKSVAKQRCEDLLRKVNMEEHRKKRLGNLSGGMKQRVLIAQALLNDPKILLLDEPTAGLDPVERKNFRQLIAEISEGKIVILATHVISDVEWIANEIIMMKHGGILTKASQEELLELTKVYETKENVENYDDETLKIVNVIRTKEGNRTRFISKKEYEHQVTTTLDDVYLDWLG